MQTIGILGSTGSIGTNTLDVISRFPDRFKVSLLTTNSNIDLLWEQVKRFSPLSICVVDINKAKKFKQKLKPDVKKIKFYEGEEGLNNIVANVKLDILVVGIVGSSALLPVLKALKNIHRLALANKEVLVMAGDIIIRKAKENDVKIMPVDSEHSAIFQCIESKNVSEIKRIYLTGSGGPLLHTPKDEFKDITPESAINHPKWRMGRKISIDSATMMNKGLEVIEAKHLFGIDVNKIQVLIHPQAVVHSMVEFIDGSIIAQMAMCDMRMPIQYALTYPLRCPSFLEDINFSRVKTLDFDLPDFKKFPCLEIAYNAAISGGTYPCVLNAGNEIAVEEFLRRSIRFTDIPRVIGKVLGKHKPIQNPELSDILEVDKWARRMTEELIAGL